MNENLEDPRSLHVWIIPHNILKPTSLDYDNEWNKECKYNKEHLPTRNFNRVSKMCL